MLSEDAKALMNYFKTLLNDEQIAIELPDKLAEDDDFRELNDMIKEIRQVSKALSVGDLSYDVHGSGLVLAALETFMNDFKSFTLNASEVVPLDFSTRVEPSFEFSDIFNSMTKQFHFSVSKLKESNDNFAMIFHNIPDATVLISMEEWTVMAANQTFLELTNFTEQEVLHRHLASFNLGITPEQLATSHEDLKKKGFYKNMEVTFRNNKNECYFGSISSKIINMNGKDWLLSVIRDVTDIMKLEIKLRESEARHRLLADHADDIISTVDLEGNFTYISPSVERITGYTVDEVMYHYREINYFSPEILKVMQNMLKIAKKLVSSGEHFEPIRFEQLQLRKDGSAFWSDTILSGIYDEENQFRELLGVTRDNTENVKLRDEIQKLSETDKLTQLYNRLKLDEALKKEFKKAKKKGGSFALIMLDIDHFKRINDNFGHQAGDAVLIELATTLKDSIRSRDIVGRWGGEEFLFILPATDANGAIMLAEKIRNCIREKLFPRQKSITVSLGVTVYRGDSIIETIVSRADEAMYVAKKNGRDQVRLL
ncbi:diguanylate cyclase [Acetobacterium paludosum]|uniref:Diguanylate cyclase n=1 Tax=Acetobacterium paludosum TaxID=52693 RepID=A0A923HYP6_9FIRM|nr:GGDEF domain-containing protein [Acetobacterium paludosum]MBC3889044.1 diguanylate cyclase [Acetobacterium paludosum]